MRNSGDTILNCYSGLWQADSDLLLSRLTALSGSGPFRCFAEFLSFMSPETSRGEGYI